MNDAASRIIPESEKKEQRRLWLMVHLGPPFLVGIHFAFYFFHLILTGPPSKGLGELVSLGVLLIGFQNLLYRRGASRKIRDQALKLSLFWSAIALVAAYVMFMSWSAGL